MRSENGFFIHSIFALSLLLAFNFGAVYVFIIIIAIEAMWMRFKNILWNKRSFKLALPSHRYKFMIFMVIVRSFTRMARKITLRVSHENSIIVGSNRNL